MWILFEIGMVSALFKCFYILTKSSIGRFQRIFVCPAQNRQSFQLCRRLIALDGTFLKARFILTLLLAVGIDANGELYPLAWAVVESENSSSWEWFLERLQWSLPAFSEEPATIISDRDKGLQEAESVLGPLAKIAFCCYHLKGNFTDKFGRALAPHFWKVARAKTRAAYDAALTELRTIKPEAAFYLEAASPETWATAFFPGQRYGHDTSNVAESLNQVLRFDRELPILELLDSIWHRVMEKRADRLAAALKAIEEGRDTTPFVEGKIVEGRKWAQSNHVQPSSPTVGRVVQPNGTIYLVDLAARTCSCCLFQENGIPCGHAMSMIFLGGGDLTPYLPPILSAAQWAATYRVPLPPIDVSGLAINLRNICDPPATRIPRGRPKKECVRREDARRPRGRQEFRDHGGMLALGTVVAAVPDQVRSHCSTCGESGHNSRRCRRPHN
jgi:hypothetical protein